METVKEIGNMTLFIMYWLLWPKGAHYDYFESLKLHVTYGAKINPSRDCE